MVTTIIVFLVCAAWAPDQPTTEPISERINRAALYISEEFSVAACDGEIYSRYKFPRGSRPPGDPPGTDYPDGWKVDAAMGEVAAAVFDRPGDFEVIRVLFCRPRDGSLPVPLGRAVAIVRTAEVFADDFELGDTSAWSGASP